MDATQSFRVWLKQRRKALDLTQAELAERADCSVESVQQIESGREPGSAKLRQKLRECLTLSETQAATDGASQPFMEWLREQRRARRWTQEDLANKIGTTGVHVSNIENGKKQPSRQLAEQLALVFGFPKEDHASFIAFARGAVTLPPILPGLVRRPSAVPAAPTPTRNNLPAQLSRFVGREREIGEVIGLLAGSRLVTLTGPGGAGKTRLALAVGERVRNDYAEGVSWVALANITDPAMVAATIAATFGIKETGEVPVAALLASWLQNRDLLLILDNLEQLTAATPLLRDLLEAAPQLKMLVTSRIVLEIYGEQEYPVHLLSLPALGTTDLDTLAASEAVTLFAVRAHEVRPDFELTAETAPIVAAICTRLEGLPLAIELAAARIKLLPPATLLSRLNESPLLSLLVGGARTLPDRQKTLRATIAWSYDLLDPHEQTLFRRLAVFAGNWTLEAAEAVCEVPGLPILDGLESLLNKSLISQQDADGEPRFAMLTTIREYAGEQLIAQGEESVIRGAHLRYYRTLAERAAPQLQGAAQKTWFDRFEQEHDNLRAALTWAEGKNTAAILDLVAALWLFWSERGYWTEGQHWVALALTLDVTQQQQAHLLLGAGTLARLRGDNLNSHRHLDAALALYRALGDHRGQSACLYQLADLARNAGNKEASARLGAESVSLARAVGDPIEIAKALLFCVDEGDEDADARFQEALTLAQAQNYLPGIAMAVYRLGGQLEGRGDLEGATTLYLDSLAQFRELGDQRRIVTVTEVLGEVAEAQGDLDQALPYYESALALWRAMGHQPGLMSASYNLAKLARATGQWQIMYEYAVQGLQIARDIGNARGIRDGLLLLGHAQLHLDQAAAAIKAYREALEALSSPPPPQILARLVVGLAFAFAVTGRLVEAAHLLGTAATCGPLESHDQLDYDHSLALVQAGLESPLVEIAQATGSTWTPADILAAMVVPT